MKRPLASNAEQVKSAVLAALPDLLGQWLPSGKLDGVEYVALNPQRDDKNLRSFRINIETGKWRDHAIGKGGSDPSSLYAYLFTDGDRRAAFATLAKDPLVQAAMATGATATPAKTANVAKDSAEKRSEARRAYQDAKNLLGTPATVYLRNRGLKPTDAWEGLRASAMAHPGRRGRHPVLLAPIEAPNGSLLGVHRTYLTNAGAKLDVTDPRRTMGQVRGGAIRLGKVNQKLIVCEGLEDGLTLYQQLKGKIAVWVAGGAGFLHQMVIPEIVRSITIAADNDDAGEEAARRAADAFGFGSREVTIMRPKTHFKDFNAQLVDPQTRDRDVEEQFRNAERVERPAPLPLRREAPPPLPFPRQALGKLLGEAVDAIVDTVKVAPEMAAQSVLAGASLSTQALANVDHPAVGPRPLSCFFVTVAPTGERKSSADGLALEPIKIREMDLRDARDRNARAYRDSKDLYDRERQAIIKLDDERERDRKLASLRPEPRPPLSPLLLVPEPTLEGLHKLMAVGEPSLGLFNDEGGTFIGGHGMTPESRLRTGAGLSDLWDGKPIKRVRGGDGVTMLFNRRLTVHIMAQPGVADGLLDDPVLQQQGLPSRLLVSAPAILSGSRPKFRLPNPESAVALKRYTNRLLELLRLPQPRKAADDPELRPRLIKLSSAAYKLWAAFVDECEEGMAEGNTFEPIRGFANKAAEHALRLAGVLALVENPKASEITGPILERACTLVRYYLSEAVRLFDNSAPAELQGAEKLLKYLQQRGKPLVDLGHLCQFGPYSIRRVADMRRAMGVLERYCWVKKIPRGAKIEGQHHREVWEIFKA